jgi:hypothetical protein
MVFQKGQVAWNKGLHYRRYAIAHQFSCQNKSRCSELQEQLTRSLTQTTYPSKRYLRRSRTDGWLGICDFPAQPARFFKNKIKSG